MRTFQQLFTLLLIAIIAISCKKNSADKKQQPCPGGCGIADFSIIDYQSAWSPDGKSIAYYHVDKEISKNGIYLITPEGRENRLWHRGVGAETPTWSPDGQWIAFSEGAQIWKKKLNGDSLIQITNTGRNFFPSWSPDGKWIAYDNTDCGSVVTPAPSNSCGILLANNLEKKLIVSGRVPSWINNSSFIYLGLYSEIFKYNLIDSSKTQLTFLNFKDKYAYTIYHIRSSKEDKILYTSQPQNGLPQIWVMNADGTNQQQLTQTGGYTSDWSPDGKYIVFTDSRSVNGRLWIMNADGSGKHQFTFKEIF